MSVLLRPFDRPLLLPCRPVADVAVVVIRPLCSRVFLLLLLLALLNLTRFLPRIFPLYCYSPSLYLFSSRLP